MQKHDDTKKGYWMYAEWDGFTPVCSVCKMTHHEIEYHPAYCPHCGAKMENREDEQT